MATKAVQPKLAPDDTAGGGSDPFKKAVLDKPIEKMTKAERVAAALTEVEQVIQRVIDDPEKEELLPLVTTRKDGESVFDGPAEKYGLSPRTLYAYTLQAREDSKSRLPEDLEPLRDKLLGVKRLYDTAIRKKVGAALSEVEEAIQRVIDDPKKEELLLFSPVTGKRSVFDGPAEKYGLKPSTLYDYTKKAREGSKGSLPEFLEPLRGRLLGVTRLHDVARLRKSGKGLEEAQELVDVERDESIKKMTKAEKVEAALSEAEEAIQEVINNPENELLAFEPRSKSSSIFDDPAEKYGFKPSTLYEYTSSAKEGSKRNLPEYLEFLRDRLLGVKRLHDIAIRKKVGAGLSEVEEAIQRVIDDPENELLVLVPGIVSPSVFDGPAEKYGLSSRTLYSYTIMAGEGSKKELPEELEFLRVRLLGVKRLYDTAIRKKVDAALSEVEEAIQRVIDDPEKEELLAFSPKHGNSSVFDGIAEKYGFKPSTLYQYTLNAKEGSKGKFPNSLEPLRGRLLGVTRLHDVAKLRKSGKGLEEAQELVGAELDESIKKMTNAERVAAALTEVKQVIQRVIDDPEKEELLAFCSQRGISSVFDGIAEKYGLSSRTLYDYTIKAGEGSKNKLPEDLEFLRGRLLGVKRLHDVAVLRKSGKSLEEAEQLVGLTEEQKPSELDESIKKMTKAERVAAALTEVEQVIQKVIDGPESRLRNFCASGKNESVFDVPVKKYGFSPETMNNYIKQAREDWKGQPLPNDLGSLRGRLLGVKRLYDTAIRKKVDAALSEVEAAIQKVIDDPERRLRNFYASGKNESVFDVPAKKYGLSPNTLYGYTSSAKEGSKEALPEYLGSLRGRLLGVKRLHDIAVLRKSGKSLEEAQELVGLTEEQEPSEKLPGLGGSRSTTRQKIRLGSGRRSLDPDLYKFGLPFSQSSGAAEETAEIIAGLIAEGVIPKDFAGLDVGTGPGTFTSVLKDKGVEPGIIVGADLSKEMLMLAAREDELVVATAMRMPFRDGSFDVSNSTFMLNQLKTKSGENFEKALFEIARVTKEGGLVFVSLPKNMEVTEEMLEGFEGMGLELLNQSGTFMRELKGEVPRELVAKWDEEYASELGANAGSKIAEQIRSGKEHEFKVIVARRGHEVKHVDPGLFAVEKETKETLAQEIGLRIETSEELIVAQDIALELINSGAFKPETVSKAYRPELVKPMPRPRKQTLGGVGSDVLQKAKQMREITRYSHSGELKELDLEILEGVSELQDTGDEAKLEKAINRAEEIGKKVDLVLEYKKKELEGLVAAKARMQLSKEELEVAVGALEALRAGRFKEFRREENRKVNTIRVLYALEDADLIYYVGRKKPVLNYSKLLMI